MADGHLMTSSGGLEILMHARMEAVVLQIVLLQ